MFIHRLPRKTWAVGALALILGLSLTLLPDHDTPLPRTGEVATSSTVITPENMSSGSRSLVGTTSHVSTETVTTPSPGPTTITDPADPSDTTTYQSDTLEVAAWIYPGAPACDALTELRNRPDIDVVKIEFFTISSGALELIDAQSGLCNSYSPRVVETIRAHSREQYVTISSPSRAGMEQFFTSALVSPHREIETLVSFVVSNNLTGIEIDFEDFSSWTPQNYSDYKSFVTKLGTALHAQNKKLMLDGPPIANATEQTWYQWRYRDFVALPVDTMVVMAYDHQFDHGAGTPIAPLSWIESVVRWTMQEYPASKLSIGIPSYGYEGTVGTFRTTIRTYNELVGKPGFDNAVRDQESAELTWQQGTTVYYYQDSTSLARKRAVIAGLGIPSISVWHLGGNQWFE